MATTTYGVNDALAVKLWSKRMDTEALKDTQYAEHIGTAETSLAQEMTETSKGSGDSITWGLAGLLDGDGVSEGETLEGNEESLSTYSDSMLINELSHAVRSKAKGTIDDQRVLFDCREHAYEKLKLWVQDRLDTMFMNQLAGNTAQTNSKYFGFNTPLAPSANRWIRAGAVANDQSLGSGNVFTLNLIDKAVNIAKTRGVPIRPLRKYGRDIDYVCFVHSDQVLSLRSDTATAGNWFDLQKARLQGGDGDSSGFYSGALGIYNRVLMVESTRLPKAINASTGAAIDNTRRAVLCGAQALSVAFGKNNSKTRFTWNEKTFDYGRELGVAAGIILGMKKTRYDGEDYGTVTISTYAAPAA